MAYDGHTACLKVYLNMHLNMHLKIYAVDIKTGINHA